MAIKNALQKYLASARMAQAKQDEARKIYQAEVADKECGRIAAWLDGEREAASQAIEAERNQRVRALDAWRKLDGDKLTSDIGLLNNDLISAEQFPEMVERYKDNWTMLSALSKYADRRNEQLRKEIGSGKSSYPDIDRKLFPAGIIPTPESKAEQINKTVAKAYSVIGMIDNGFMGYGGGANSPMVEAAVNGFAE